MTSTILNLSALIFQRNCYRCLSTSAFNANPLKFLDVGRLFTRKDRITIVRFPEEISNLQNEMSSTVGCETAKSIPDCEESTRCAADSEVTKTSWQNVHLSIEDVKSKRVQFLPLYHFKYVTHVRMFSRMKIYLTALTTGALPPYVAALYLNEICGLGDVCLTMALASLSVGVLYWLSLYTRGLVGFLYVSDCGNWIRIAHLTFWGNRNDVIVPSDRIVPMHKTGRPGSSIKSLEVDGLDQSFVYVYGKAMRIIYDYDSFHHYFGTDMFHD